MLHTCCKHDTLPHNATATGHAFTQAWVLPLEYFWTVQLLTIYDNHSSTESGVISDNQIPYFSMPRCKHNLICLIMPQRLQSYFVYPTPMWISCRLSFFYDNFSRWIFVINIHGIEEINVVELNEMKGKICHTKVNPFNGSSFIYGREH